MRLDPELAGRPAGRFPRLGSPPPPAPLNIPGSSDFQVKGPHPVSHAVRALRPPTLGLGFSLVDRKYWGFVAIVSVKNLTFATITYS